MLVGIQPQAAAVQGPLTYRPFRFGGDGRNGRLTKMICGVFPCPSALHKFEANLLLRFIPVTGERRHKWKKRAFLGISGGLEVDEEDPGEHLQLDSSVFENAFPSIDKLNKPAKPAGSRVKGLPIPQSTLIPDDWKAVQEYYHRGKNEIKRERLALQMEWARKRALEARATPGQTENDERQLASNELGDGLSVDQVADQQRENHQGEESEFLEEVPSAATSGRAWPTHFRGELQFSNFQDIASELREAKLENKQVEVTDIGGEEDNERDEGDTRELLRNKSVLFTAEEKAVLKNRNLDFAKISSKSWSPLHTLAASGQVYLAAELLKKGVELDSVDSDGLTPLFRAVQAGRKTMIRMLLKAGANALVLDKAGATLLHYSARAGNEEISKILLRHGVDINAADADGWTALHIAVQCGRLELIKALVYRGADLNLTNADGRTALDLALAFGGCFNFYDAIKFLKKKMVFDSENRSDRAENEQSI